MPQGVEELPSISSRVVATYERALADEKMVLARPRTKAKKDRKELAARLAFSPAAEEAVERFLRRHPKAADGPGATVDQLRAAHREAMGRLAQHLPSYRPSERFLADLQESWIPYSELLLAAAKQLSGEDFSALKPRLKQLGFSPNILDYFRPAQARKYFLQQTPTSIATLIVSRRIRIRVEQDTVKRAGNRLYSRFRPKRKRE